MTVSFLAPGKRCGFHSPSEAARSSGERSARGFELAGRIAAVQLFLCHPIAVINHADLGRRNCRGKKVCCSGLRLDAVVDSGPAMAPRQIIISKASCDVITMTHPEGLNKLHVPERPDVPTNFQPAALQQCPHLYAVLIVVNGPQSLRLRQ